MYQQIIVKKIIKNCFSTFSARLIFILISKNDFCTRKELLKWTGFSVITISKYLQEFSKAGLINQAPGIIYLSKFGDKIFEDLMDLLKYEEKVAQKLLR